MDRRVRENRLLGLLISALHEAGTLPASQTLRAGLDETCQLRRLSDDAGFDGSFRTRRGGEQPDATGIREVAHCVDETVDKISILVPPPAQNHITDVVSVLVYEIGTDHVFERLANVAIGIVIPPQFLNNETRTCPQDLRVILLATICHVKKTFLYGVKTEYCTTYYRLLLCFSTKAGMNHTKVGAST